MNTYVAIRDTVTTIINTIDALGRAEIFLTRNPPSIMRSHDMIARTYPQEHNRRRVHLKVMDARLGMRILDYVSLERPWNKCLQILSDKKKYGRLVRSFMFLCREPLGHVMSQCRELHHVFDCQANKFNGSDQISIARGTQPL